MPLRKFTEVQREAAAEVVLRIVAARLLARDVSADEVAQVAGVTRVDIEAALERRRAVRRRYANQRRGLGQTPNRTAPPGTKWCSGLPGESGHYVSIEAMARNASSPDGLYNKCRAHHAAREKARKSALRARAKPPLS